jgi:signal peptidase I
MRWWTARLGALAVLLLLAVGWSAFAPTQVGGRATYLMTEGVSMLPTYRGGDLVVLQRASSYEVGDVVAYRDPDIGEVFHRIIGREGDRFIMKGDNNPHEDVYHPATSDILGRLWLSFQGGGNWLLVARKPPVAASLAGGAALLTMLPVVGKRRGRRRLAQKTEDNGQPQRHPRRERGAAGALGPVGQAALFLTVVAAAAAIAGAAVSFSQPVDRAATSTLAYTQSGRFSYAAVDAPAGIYDTTSAKTGDPIYRLVTPGVKFTFAYQLSSAAAADVTGTAAMHAELHADNGWTRSIPLQSGHPFTGASVSLAGTLDLDAIQAMIDTYHHETGTGASDPVQFEIDIVPQVSLTGTLGGAPLTETYAPSLALQYQYDQLTLPASANSSTGSPSAPIDPSNDSQLKVATTEPNTLDLVFFALAVETVRVASLIAGFLSTLLLLLLLAMSLLADSADESVKIQARYPHMLVALKGSLIADSGQTFDVETIEDLIRVAEREGRMVLHETRPSEHTYFVQDAAAAYTCSEHIYYVQDADATYRYRTVDRPVADASAVTEVTT